MAKVLKKDINSKKLVIPLFVVWIIFSLMYFIFSRDNSNLVSGYFSLVGQVGLDVVAAILTFQLYMSSKESKKKFIFLMFFISFFSAIFADSIYNLTMKILNIKYFSSINSFFEIPFILFLLFQVIAWGKIFFSGNENISNSKKKYPYTPYVIFSTLIFSMFIFGIPWKISHFSLVGLYQVVDTFLEVIGYTLVTICLARAKNLMLRFTSIGYLMIISSDLLIRYDVVSGIIPTQNFFETTWVLGLLLMTVGFFVKDKQIKLLNLNSLQSCIAIWLLNICLLLVILFALASYLFSSTLEIDQVNKNLLAIIIPFSIIAIISSKFLSAKISFPLENLESIVRNFSNEGVLLKQNKSESNYIHEFLSLEKFVYNSLDLCQKNHFYEMEFAKMATQVAHDIKSPMIALNNYFNETFKIDSIKGEIIESKYAFMMVSISLLLMMTIKFIIYGKICLLKA